MSIPSAAFLFQKPWRAVIRNRPLLSNLMAEKQILLAIFTANCHSQKKKGYSGGSLYPLWHLVAASLLLGQNGQS
jgi:hypothetical protein